MVGAAFLGIAFVRGVILSGRWFVSAEPRDVVRFARWTGIVVAAGLAVYLVVSGRIAWALGAASAALPLLLRLWQAHRAVRGYARMAGVGGRGHRSRVETAGLRMTLDHDSGHLDGEVRTGRFAGRRLSDLDRGELLALLAAWRDEPGTRQVLEAYLDRCHPDWRNDPGAPSGPATSGDATSGGEHPDGERSRPATPPGSGAMSREEALAVLGLPPDAGEDEIKAAHHRLIAGLHPDRGGSNWLAANVNEARRVLLGR